MAVNSETFAKDFVQLVSAGISEKHCPQPATGPITSNASQKKLLNTKTTKCNPSIKISINHFETILIIVFSALLIVSTSGQNIADASLTKKKYVLPDLPLTMLTKPTSEWRSRYFNPFQEDTTQLNKLFGKKWRKGLGWAHLSYQRTGKNIDIIRQIYPRLFSGRFSNDIEFRRIKIKRKIDFKGYFTPAHILFDRCHFESKMSFAYNKSTLFNFFLSNISFDQSIFEKKVLIWDDVYFTPLSFHECTFKDTLYSERGMLSPLEFYNTVSFRGSKFNGLVAIENFPAFYRGADFSETTFRKKVNIRAVIDTLVFIKSVFHDTIQITSHLGYADFGRSTFHKLLTFQPDRNRTWEYEGSDFTKGLSLYQCDLKEGARFDHCFVDGFIDLRYSTSDGIIDLSKLKRYPKSFIDEKNKKLFYEKYKNKLPIKIYLTGSKLPGLNLKYADFELCFTDKDNYEDKTEIYENLLKIQKEHGYLSSFEKLDKEYKSFILISKDAYFQDWIARNWWDYGYNKFLVIQNTVILFCIFYLINALLFNKLITEIYHLEKLNIFTGVVSKSFSGYISSAVRYMERVFFYTFFIFFGFKISIDNFRFNPTDRISLHSVGIIYIIFQYITGIICVAYMANFIITR